MPALLKFLTCHAFIALILLPASFFPNDLLSYNGKILSYEELWSSGAGWFTVLAGVSLPFSAYLLLNKAKSSRSVYLVSLFIIFNSSYILNGIDSIEYLEILIMLIIFTLLFVYLYMSKGVKSYIGSNNAVKRDQ